MKFFSKTHLSTLFLIYYFSDFNLVHSKFLENKNNILPNSALKFKIFDKNNKLTNFLISNEDLLRVKNFQSNFVQLLQNQTSNLTSINCDLYNPAAISDEFIRKTCKFTLNPPISKRTNVVCNPQTCARENGFCSTNGQCQCLAGFYDDPDLKQEKFCSYHQRRQVTFFLLEFFLPFGIGHLCNGRIIYGVIKLLVFLAIILTDVITKIVLISKNERGTKPANIISFVYYFILILWQAYDVTMIGFNKFTEQNNVPYIQVEY